MIKIRLEKWEKAVVMQVLEMDEELRRKGIIFDNGDMTIESVTSPEMEENIIFVRGDKETDFFVTESRCFENKKERDRYYNRVVQLFKDYNNRDKQEENQDNIFILK